MNGTLRLRADWRTTRHGIVQVCEPVPFLEQLELGQTPADRYLPHRATCRARVRRAS